MSDTTDPSTVYAKVAQYYVRQKLDEVKNRKKMHYKSQHAGAKPESYSWDHLSAHKPQQGQPARVAIIGAGVAGLRTAMLLQHCGIPYKIFEANDGPGGRLFTYHFPSDPKTSPAGKHDYFEVGGMRFPNNAANQPTFDLFQELGFRFRDAENPNGELIPFIYGKDDNIRHFNSKS